MIRTVTLALTALSLGAQAGATCAVQAAGADLPEFTAAQSWRGSLRVTVRCDRPDDTYLLRLGSGAGPLTADGLNLRLALGGPDGQTLNARILNASSLNVQTWTGSRAFAFTLTIADQAWVRAGTYAAPLTVELQSVTDGPGALTAAPRPSEGVR
ncbi:hypothetical protein [Deinococcus depolymerans]|uniref:Spore coat protein U domain-containing protein n=1 Tax=Deinococcus depolymerans TaxID=392408 RepID=A0ABP3M6Q9_9DEIO